MAAPALSYVADQVRRFDHDRFLTALFVPAARREAVLALFAFNLELARARELVREPMMGLLRLQWWRDAVEGIYGGAPRRHEVIAPLAAAIRDHRLERGLVDRLIDAREADMNPAPPADLAALAGYAAATSGTLARLVMAVLAGSGGVPPGAGDAAEAIGSAWALTGLIRAVPFHARARRLYLPQTVIDRAGLDVGELFELRSSPALAEACRVVAEAAGERLAEGRRRGRVVPRALRPALLPATLADLYLARLARAGCDPFDPRVQQPAPGRAWRLLLASLAGRV
jgi:NADH dehydrogenase [ubiquinone] 1 alpha subcomplex assembly factor 6